MHDKYRQVDIKDKNVPRLLSVERENIHTKFVRRESNSKIKKFVFVSYPAGTCVLDFTAIHGDGEFS